MEKTSNGIMPHIGEIYVMRFCGDESEQQGTRPGLVFQNNIGNKFSPNIIALPLTSATKKKNQPTHVLIKSCEGGLRVDSMVLCENPERMSKEKIGNYITSLSNKDMARVAAANLLASSAISFIDPDMLLAVWQQAVVLNNGRPKCING